MTPEAGNLEIIRKTMFRLLPIQVLFAAVGSVNGLVSSYFATNFVGIDAMTAVGLYSPFALLISAIATVLAGGCAIICGKYLGKNRIDKIQDIFSMDLLVTTGLALAITLIIALMGAFNLTGMLTHDPEARQVLNIYMIGQAIGIVPFMLSTQLAPFLSLESMSKRTMQAGLVYVVMNLILCFIFVQVLGLEAFGLALSSSLGMWALFAVEIQYFLSKKSNIKINGGSANLGEMVSIITVGFPGAATTLYLTIRGLIVNNLLDTHVGVAGISAFATANNLLGIFWAIYSGQYHEGDGQIFRTADNGSRRAHICLCRAAHTHLLQGPFAKRIYNDCDGHPHTLFLYAFRGVCFYLLMLRTDQRKTVLCQFTGAARRCYLRSGLLCHPDTSDGIQRSQRGKSPEWCGLRTLRHPVCMDIPQTDTAQSGRPHDDTC